MDPTPTAKQIVRFVSTSFDAEIHRPVKKARTSRGRQGNFTEHELRKSREVRVAGGQCNRCRKLKKKVSD